MQYIPGHNEKAQWSVSLLHDLVFIKKHLRYPFSKKTLPRALVIGVLLLLIFRMINLVLFVQGRAPLVIKWVVIPVIIIVILGVFYQYYLALKFKSIPTVFFANENMKLVEGFLQSQQLAMYRHPEAPEVFQIISTPIGNPKNEQREVMIFIADDKRILVNSHFVNLKYSTMPPSHNARKMANRLRDWIKIHHPDAQTGLTVQ